MLAPIEPGGPPALALMLTDPFLPTLPTMHVALATTEESGTIDELIRSIS